MSLTGLWGTLFAEVELPALREKLLISFQDFVWQRHASLGAAKDSCFLQRENCTGVMQLHGTHYTMNGTVLVDSPGSGATLYIKSGSQAPLCWVGPRGQQSGLPCGCFFLLHGAKPSSLGLLWVWKALLAAAQPCGEGYYRSGAGTRLV